MIMEGASYGWRKYLTKCIFFLLLWETVGGEIKVF